MQHKKIILKDKGDENITRHLETVLGIDTALATILVQRNIKTFDEAKAFFRPSLDQLHDPFLMKNMDKAVERLENAISNNEKILVYGDYDVDGTTSVALVYSFLSEYYDALDYYIPDRDSEGYGISYKGIDYAKDEGISLIIALDCGIKACEKVDYAKQKGIDFIICDHHTPGEFVPDAVAVLDPKQKDCKYPYDELSGCGVGFKFMQAYANRNQIPFEKLVKYIDLIAVSIASDIVPMTGENRILAFHGLKKLNEDPIIGLKAIKKIAGVENRKLTISDCVFKIGPRINAAGRIKSGKAAVKLMISGDSRMAAEFGREIDLLNTNRKNIDRDITHQALRLIGNDIELRNRKSTVLFNPEWHKGVVGIVASRLIETYYRPTIILTESKGMATGSARSVLGFNVYDAIESCSDLLVNFGGHKYAAGLTMKVDKVEEFSRCFEQYVSEHITPEQLTPVIEVDVEIDLEKIHEPKFFRILEQFAPFGPGNMTPIFITRALRDAGKTMPVGQTKEHLKLNMIDHKDVVLDGIGFSMAHHYRDMTNNKFFTICYSIDKNDFKGKTSLQAMVKDIQTEDDRSKDFYLPVNA